MSATPRPWAVDDSDKELFLSIGVEPSDWTHVKGPDGRHIAGTYCRSEDENAANAALIVRAVNSHDGLKASLKELLSYARDCGANRVVLDRASAAIAAAEGDAE